MYTSSRPPLLQIKQSKPQLNPALSTLLTRRCTINVGGKSFLRNQLHSNMCAVCRSYSILMWQWYFNLLHTNESAWRTQISNTDMLQDIHRFMAKLKHNAGLKSRFIVIFKALTDILTEVFPLDLYSSVCEVSVMAVCLVCVSFWNRCRTMQTDHIHTAAILLWRHAQCGNHS